MRPQTTDMHPITGPRQAVDLGRAHHRAATALTHSRGTAGPLPGRQDHSALRAALAAATEDALVYDLDGIGRQYAALCAELPGVAMRFAMKACPVDEVLGHLARLGAGFDAASPQEIAQALRAGAAPGLVHYGNTVKSDRNIAAAYRLGVRDFATDSLEDVMAIAQNAPGARVFCRIATTGEGALWGLSRKFGCSPEDVPRVLGAARALGLVPSGLSLHVGSQQMTAEAWVTAIDSLAAVLRALGRCGITPDRINLGGGLPALGVLDRCGRPLVPPLSSMFTAIREGMERLRAAHSVPLDFLLEPGRHLVADHGAIRAHVARLTSRHRLDGTRERWLYLSCGKFNGLYEMDQLQYRLEFPTHPGGQFVDAVVAGPTCDSDDAFAQEGGPVRVPRALASGDPVWIHSCGAYATAYTTRGFNGFEPLPCTCVGGRGQGGGEA
ncbi:type III PLP-dependent enzyme [Streptomyces sp. NPDC019224]|uniref:type III PLP-dependent enzyme n=1 Tax=Streptomyces sp. NPDC019224 TaxID=3154484 RepID=UPI0033E3E2B7